VTATFIVIAFVLVQAAVAASLTSVSRSPSSPATPAFSHETSTPTPLCRKRAPAIRSTVVDRRLATWGHQDALAVPRTRTGFRERVAIGCAYLRWIRGHWTTLADSTWRDLVELRDPRAAIAHVFGVYASEAIAVSSCETGGTFDVWASNGQYLGLFQMGSSERRTYGHGSTALAQARAAWRYFVASGRDWSPWSCRP